MVWKKTIFGNEERCYDAERTICDLLRSRNHMDEETVISAIKNYAVFTDWGEIYKWQGCPSQKTIVFSFENYAEMIQNDPDISGIVIDPFGANFIVDRKLSEHLRTTKDIITKGVSEQKVAKDTTVWLGEPKVYPTEMIEAVKDHLQKEPAVKKAWMRLISGSELLMIQNLFIFAGNEEIAIVLKEFVIIIGRKHSSSNFTLTIYI